MSTFIQIYSESIEFHFIDAPFVSGIPPIQAFKKRGFTGGYEKEELENNDCDSDQSKPVKNFAGEASRIRVFGQGLQERHYCWFQAHKKLVNNKEQYYDDT